MGILNIDSVFLTVGWDGDIERLTRESASAGRNKKYCEALPGMLNDGDCPVSKVLLTLKGLALRRSSVHFFFVPGYMNMSSAVDLAAIPDRDVGIFAGNGGGNVVGASLAAVARCGR